LTTIYLRSAENITAGTQHKKPGNDIQLFAHIKSKSIDTKLMFYDLFLTTQTNTLGYISVLSGNKQLV
jgi:hypothetical protein